MSISPELYARLRDALLRCHEFDDNRSLQNLFVRSELSGYRYRVPQASTPYDRVRETIAWLDDERLSDQRPVLPLFLGALRDEYPQGDARWVELERLRVEVEQAQGLASTVSVPFVIVAMTGEEAAGLQDGTVFENPRVAPIEHERFSRFSAALQNGGFADLLSHYGADREGWSPHTHPEHTVREIVDEIASYVNQERTEKLELPAIQPEFFSSGFFAEEEETRLETWERLSRSGCVIIVDVVSMFHPVLRDRLVRSAMGSNERVAILVFFPVSSSALPIHQMIEQEICSEMQRAFARFSRSLDRLCEFGVGDLRALQRWLFAVLPETAKVVSKQRPIPANKVFLRSIIGQPTGKAHVIVGRRGLR